MPGQLIKRPLVVHANPFHALDAHGRAACAVRLDPETAGNRRLYIGATRKAELLESHPEGDGRFDVHDLTWDFDLSAQHVADTAYHRERVRHGELIAGDALTAKRSSLGEQQVTFRPVGEVLAEEQTKACDVWEAEHPDDGVAAARALDVAVLLAKHEVDAKAILEAEAKYVAAVKLAAEKAKAAAQSAGAAEKVHAAGAAAELAAHAAEGT